MNNYRYIKGIKAYLKELGFSPDIEDWEIVPFWGCAQEKAGVVDKGCLSNHYVRNFDFQGHTFNSVEQGMMYFKAVAFNDHETAAMIMEEKWPPNQKRLGRRVRNYDDSFWRDIRYIVVRDLCLAKFTQHEDMKKFLLSFSDKTVFVEASPFDRIWGVELPEYAPEIADIHQWQGENLLGFIHTENMQSLKSPNPRIGTANATETETLVEKPMEHTSEK